MKILHLPEAVGGNAIGLSTAEKKLGYDSRVLTFDNTYFNYPQDICIDLKNKNLLMKFISRGKAFLKYRSDFDVYHFNFGSSILHAPQYKFNLTDAPFYSSKATKIFTYQGCDARQKYPTITRLQNRKSDQAACFESNCYGGVCNSGKRDLQRQQAIEKAAKYADHFFALNPDLLYFLPKGNTNFLPYTIARFDEIFPKEGNFFKNDKIRIVHSPTQQAAKGTKYILSALQELQAQYPDRLEVKLIEGYSHEKALEEYRKADLFIDQLLVGWYGAVAVEVMKMGIPVASFINEADLEFVPQQMIAELPIIRINKNNIKEELIKVINQRELLIERGKQGIAFVNKWHNPVNIAKYVSAIYSKQNTVKLENFIV